MTTEMFAHRGRMTSNGSSDLGEQYFGKWNVTCSISNFANIDLWLAPFRNLLDDNSMKYNNAFGNIVFQTSTILSNP